MCWKLFSIRLVQNVRTSHPLCWWKRCKSVTKVSRSAGASGQAGGAGAIAEAKAQCAESSRRKL